MSTHDSTDVQPIGTIDDDAPTDVPIDAAIALASESISGIVEKDQHFAAIGATYTTIRRLSEVDSR